MVYVQDSLGASIRCHKNAASQLETAHIVAGEGFEDAASAAMSVANGADSLLQVRASAVMGGACRRYYRRLLGWEPAVRSAALCGLDH